MIQTSKDRMCRGGSSGPRRRACSIGPLFGRVLALIAALMIAAGGAGSVRANAASVEPGFVMVICSDGVAKTVVLDGEGNPVEPSGDEACLDHGPCCTLPEIDALPPDLQASAVWKPVAKASLFRTGTASLRSEARRRPNARGPPSKEDA